VTKSLAHPGRSHRHNVDIAGRRRHRHNEHHAGLVMSARQRSDSQEHWRATDDILKQFLAESTMLSLFGGAIESQSLTCWQIGCGAYARADCAALFAVTVALVVSATVD